MIGSNAYAQETGGKKLRNTEKAKPTKLNNRKVKTAKKGKIKGNPNKSKQKVESSNPAKWDWSKIMWFRAKKSDYKTKSYNPNKRTKRKTYDNDPNYQTEHREPGEGNGELARPIIPYDTRIDDKGPILVKKRKPKNLDVKDVGPTVDVPSINIIRPDETLSRKRDTKKNVGVQDVGPMVDVPSINIIRPEETLSKKSKNNADRKVDGDRLYTSKEWEKPKPYDQSKLESISVDKDDPDKMDDDRLMTIKRSNDKPKPFDDEKLMTIKRSDDKPKPFDDKKLMTVEYNKDKPKPFDDKKLMTSEVYEPKKQKLHDDRLLIELPKVERSKLHDDRLLTEKERNYPSSTMKRISEDIAAYQGEYKYEVKKGKDYHPSSRHLSSKRHGLPWLSKTQQTLSMLWSKVWPWDLQPTYVTDKKPKIKRDKKEGQIWDNSVHPDTWNVKIPQAESGEDK